MSDIVFFLFSCLAFAQSNNHNRFRRQYWGGTPYYGPQYYETHPHQWSSQYQNNQNRDYYSPYFYGYQRQQTWQNSNQNVYQTQYNRPSWIAERNNGYATAPPDYSYQSGYARPKYLATMQPKPTLSPVILERSTFFVTQQPEMLTTSTNGRHPTFLERLGVSALPVVPNSESEENEVLKSLESSEHAQLGNGEFLPGRSDEGHLEEENLETTSAPVTEEPTSTSEPSVMEKDEIASAAIFGSSVPQTVATTEAFVEATTTAELEAESSHSSEETTQETSTSPSTTTEVTTFASSTTTTVLSTTTVTTTPVPVTTTTETETTTTVDVKPVTLLAFQEVTDEVVSSASNVTQSTVDQDTTGAGSSVTGDGSGVDPTEEDRSTFSTGIIGLRSPPLPKTTDPEKVGLEVVEWTDNDNEVRKVLTQ